MTELSEEQAMIRDMVKEFARDVLAPGAAERDKSHEFPHEEVKQMGQLGLFGMLIPEEWGGSGAGYTAMSLAIEEIAAFTFSPATSLRYPPRL